MRFLLSPRAVLRAGGICFPHNRIGHSGSGGQTRQLPGHLIVKILCHIFRRGIHGAERLKIVYELEVQPPDNVAQHALELGKIAKQTDRIKLWPRKRNAHPVVMAMNILALATVTPQRVSRRKSLFHTDLKHSCSMTPELLSAWV